EGQTLPDASVPFARSIAATVVSLQDPCAMDRLDQTAAAGAMELQPFERGRRSLLAVALPVAPGIQVVLELFDKQIPFAPAGERAQPPGRPWRPTRHCGSWKRCACWRCGTGPGPSSTVSGWSKACAACLTASPVSPTPRRGYAETRRWPMNLAILRVPAFLR